MKEKERNIIALDAWDVKASIPYPSRDRADPSAIQYKSFVFTNSSGDITIKVAFKWYV